MFVALAALIVSTSPQEIAGWIPAQGFDRPLFGSAVAALGERGRIVIGEPLGGANGSVHVYQRGALQFSKAGLPLGDGTARLGVSVAGGADVDQDGVADLVAGAPDPALAFLGYSESSEHVLVFSGRTGDELQRYRAEDHGAVDGKVPDRRATFFGASVAFVEDVDGDGHPDVAVGSPAESDGGFDAGAIRVFSGDPDDAFADVLVSAFGGFSNGQYGFSVESVGDLDGAKDGNTRPNLLVSEPGRGRAVVLEIADDGTTTEIREFPLIPTFARNAPFPARVVPDRDGDGHRDVLLQETATRVALRSSITGALLIGFELPGVQAIEQELVVGSAGDWNGDGVPDVAIGQPMTRNGGLERCDGPSSGFHDLIPPVCDGGLYVMSGVDSSLLAYFPGDEDTQGWSFGVVLDAKDDDGFSNIALGGPYMFTQDASSDTQTFEAGDGAVQVVTEKRTPLVQRTLLAPRRGSGFGRDVASGRDLTGDGLDDLAVGAPQDGTSASNAGRACAYVGATGALLHDWLGQAEGDYFGFSVALIGDQNGDGIAEVVVGVPGADTVAFRDGKSARSKPRLLANAGTVQVLSGLDGELLLTLEGDVEDGHLGVSVAAAGDVTGDGREDFVAGAPGCLHVVPLDTCDSEGGYVRVYATAEIGAGAIAAQEVRTHRAAPGAHEFGRYLDANGRIDPDDVPDVVVAAPREMVTDATGLHIGAVYVFSGADGAELGVLRGADDYGAADPTHSTGQFGVNVTVIGDMDGRGRDDIALAAHEEEDQGFRTAVFGGNAVFAGEDFAEIESLFTVEYPYPAFAGQGYAIAGVGDIDDQPGADMVVCDPARRNDIGVRAGGLIGWTGEFEGVSDWDYYGYSLTAADVDGDGYRDLVVGTPTEPDNVHQHREFDAGTDGFETGWDRVTILLGRIDPADALSQGPGGR